MLPAVRTGLSEGPDLVGVAGGARPGLHLGAVGGAAVGEVEALVVGAQRKAVARGVGPRLRSEAAVALPDLHANTVSGGWRGRSCQWLRRGTLDERAHTRAGIETVVGTSKLDGGGARNKSPLLGRSSVAVVAEGKVYQGH